MNKNLMYTIGGLVVLGIIGAVIWYSISLRTEGHITQNTNGTQTYSNNEGTVTTGSGASMPLGWPTDVPANYSGAVMVFSGDSSPQTGKAGALVSYTLQGIKAADIQAYYKSGLEAKGWYIEGNANVGGNIILGATKDSRTFGISIYDSGNGTITVNAGLQL